MRDFTLKKEKRIANADTQHGRIANLPEQRTPQR